VGGTILYSTCTLDPLENEENVVFALKELNLELVSQDPYHFGSPGLAVDGLSELNRQMLQRFDPSVHPDYIGFFIAKFRRIK
jgi:16S rRNA C967 or C1407 C5-methylase (RsmB/RsmF family)